MISSKIILSLIAIFTMATAALGNGDNHSAAQGTGLNVSEPGKMTKVSAIDRTKDDEANPSTDLDLSEKRELDFDVVFFFDFFFFSFSFYSFSFFSFPLLVLLFLFFFFVFLSLLLLLLLLL